MSERPWMTRTRKRVLELHGDRCFYCGERALNEYGKITLDHVVAASLGGKWEVNNLVPVCFRCNSSKTGYSMANWFYRLEQKRKYHASEGRWMTKVIKKLRRSFQSQMKREVLFEN